MNYQQRFLLEATVSRHRRSKPVSSTKSAAARKTPPSSSSTPLNAVFDSQQEAHRLAVIAIDNGGSVGSALTLFDQAAEKVAERAAVTSLLSPDVMRAEAALIRRQVVEATALAEAGTLLRDAELEAAALRRRLRRTIVAEKRRFDRERRRAEGGLYANQPRSDGRPTRLAVDPEAWDVVKGESIRRRTSVGYLVGRLVADAVGHNTLPRARDDNARVTQRFARLVLLDTDTWTTFRAMAFDAHVTSTRMVGVLVEAEARRLGWRPEPERAV